MDKKKLARERRAFERYIEQAYGKMFIYLDRDPDCEESYADQLVAAGWRAWLAAIEVAERRGKRGNGRR